MPFIRSSIARKAVMSITGLMLFGFVVAHLLGNLQIFLGQDALNDYALHLAQTPLLLWPARLFLLAALMLHVSTAVSLAAENKKARPNAYVFQDTVQASYASRTMLMSGIIVFLFIIYHLMHFTLGITNPELYHLTDAKGRHDVYSMVIASFQLKEICMVYIVAMSILCFHLSHGLRSFPQSLGIDMRKFEPYWTQSAVTMALLIMIGNVAIVAACYFNFIKLPSIGGV